MANPTVTARAVRAVALCAALIVVTGPGCERARPATGDGPDPAGGVTLRGIATMPTMHLDAPAFVRPSRLEGVDPPVVYTLVGGSLREGLLVYITVAPDPRSGRSPRHHELPRCLGTETVASPRGLVTVTCDEPRSRKIAVTYPRPGGDILCMATWVTANDGDADDPRWRPIIAATDAACLSLTFR